MEKTSPFQKHGDPPMEEWMKWMNRPYPGSPVDQSTKQFVVSLQGKPYHIWLVVEPPIWKICSSKWVKIFPNVRGEKFQNMWVATTQISTSLFTLGFWGPPWKPCTSLWNTPWTSSFQSSFISRASSSIFFLNDQLIVSPSFTWRYLGCPVGSGWINGWDQWVISPTYKSYKWWYYRGEITHWSDHLLPAVTSVPGRLQIDRGLFFP